MSVLRLTFSGLPSQRNVYIGFSIYFITDFGGFCNDDKAYISLGTANVLKTVIFPCKVSLRCCHRLSTTSICFNFGSRFSLNIYIYLESHKTGAYYNAISIDFSLRNK